MIFWLIISYISSSLQIQLSVIIKSEPDYTKFTQNGSPIASPLGSRGGPPFDGGADSSAGDGKGGGYQGPGGDSGRLSTGGIYQDRDSGDFKSSSGLSLNSQSTYSPNQMKIISVLVSIAGIFCVLLLFIIAALKCGLFDSEYFLGNNFVVYQICSILLCALIWKQITGDLCVFIG